MKKVVLTFFFAFILFGMLFNPSIVLAEEDDSADDSNSAGDDSGSDLIRSGSNSNDDSDDTEDELEAEDEDETEDEDFGELRRERIEERIRNRSNIMSEFSREVVLEDGTRVKIEREIEIEDGKVKIKIKRIYTYRNGLQRTVESEIERDENGVTREIKVEGENIGIDSDLEINDLFEGNESELEAVLSNGNTTRIRVLPERAREIIRERLRTRNITNLTLEEIEDRNVPRVVYNIETNQNGRFLGVFKLAMKSETQIDPETGEILDVNRPWWAFLVSVPEEETGGDTENSLITYAEALQIAQDSNCTAEGTLNEDDYWYNDNSKTWWIDMDLDMEGCNPACVVDEEARTAEINYMCTGLA